jgi:hypothetical protein
MAITYKILGQANPAATSNVFLYQVPAGNTAVISTLNICNTGTAGAAFRAMLRPANTATMAPQHYIAYDTIVPGNDTIVITAGLTLASTDSVYVYSNVSTLSFNLFGSEIY